jgi:signal transduction histidine kinase
MFRRARLRLTVVYLALSAVALGLFSLVFFAAIATVLLPVMFDLAPEPSTEGAGQTAFQATLDAIAVGLVVANVVMVAIIALVAYILAGRTLRPIGEAHARQRRFVADASHEMRTPIAAIRATVESALATGESPTELRDALVLTERYTERLTKITDDLLLLARMSQPAAGPRESTDASVIVAETVDTFLAAHPAWPPVRLELAPDLPVRVEPTEVSRIVTNLLDNAYRYGGGATGGVRVRTSAADRDAVVDVSDQGPGIPPADIDRIFEPFHRLRDGDAAQDADHDGTGLGLAIARELAARNDGRLTLESRIGSGSTFRLSFPRAT